MYKTSLVAATLVVATLTSTVPLKTHACGGFFCTTVPINQAAEQIVFRQEGTDITAMVRILYAGNAEDFSWVVPVPNTPEISIGADATFNELGFTTQPRFILRQEGNVCPQDNPPVPAAAGAPEADSDGSVGGGVTIEEELTVGPFDITIVSSDNPDDMSIWLQENGYLLTDRGVDLLEPYVLDGMKFVALKLRSGESSGSIQPLIMKYTSDKPMVPIRLTAVAAEDDMGVLVWVVNNARAIPENYEHVIPNYTKLNWYNGTLNAYGSYQTLITDAMNEAGGQGFATDFAGQINRDLVNNLTSPALVEGNLARLDAISNDAEFLTQSILTSTNVSGALANLQTITEIRQAFVDVEIKPLRSSTALLPEGRYLTRLYTTLSADEMTLDPTFNFNSTMPDQPLNREALIRASCVNDVSNWTLTLGAGTGRDGETVLDVTGQPIPFGAVPEAVAVQPDAFERQRTSADAEPELLYQANLPTLMVAADGTVTGLPEDSGTGGGEMPVGGGEGGEMPDVTSSGSSDDGGFFGGSGPGLIVLIGLAWATRRRNSWVGPS